MVHLDQVLDVGNERENGALSAWLPTQSVHLWRYLYGVTLGYSIFLPLQHRLEDRAGEQEKDRAGGQEG